MKNKISIKMILFSTLLILFSFYGCEKTEETDNENPGSVTDFDGNVYKTVKIGNQVWMAANLRVTHYSDGTPIPLVTDNTEWISLDNNSTDKAYCWYDNNPSENALTYGALYTWAAVMNGENSSEASPSGVQGACPTGWHIPSHTEWNQLIDFIASDGHTDTEGTALKATTGWDDDNGNNGNGTDDYEFKAFPGGSRSSNYGTFAFGGGSGYWRSSTEYSNNEAYGIHLGNYRSDVYYHNYIKAGGHSVRCVKD